MVKNSNHKVNISTSELCSAAFQDDISLKSHIKFHDKRKFCSCPFSGGRFLDEQTQVIKCFVCAIQCVDNYNPEVHRKKDHNKNHPTNVTNVIKNLSASGD